MEEARCPRLEIAKYKTQEARSKDYDRLCALLGLMQFSMFVDVSQPWALGETGWTMRWTHEMHPDCSSKSTISLNTSTDVLYRFACFLVGFLKKTDQLERSGDFKGLKAFFSRGGPG